MCYPKCDRQGNKSEFVVAYRVCGEWDRLQLQSVAFETKTQKFGSRPLMQTRQRNYGHFASRYSITKLQVNS